MPELSIIILNYNTKDLTLNCLKSIQKNPPKVDFEIVLIDNASTDGSIDYLKKKLPALNFKFLHLIKNKINLGFSKGNNQAKDTAKGKYILFLNPDTIVNPDALDLPLRYLKSHVDVGAITCKVSLQDGKLDPDTRRSFPTPFVALTHFSKLDRIFPTSKFFSKYWYGYLPDSETHEIDALQGAYVLVSNDTLTKVGWFDEDYFLNGEDIDLCYKIKQLGLKIIYLPTSSITHIKGAAKGKNKDYKKVPLVKKFNSIMHGVNAMEIFYKKHLAQKYDPFTNFCVWLGIRAIKIQRFVTLVLTS